MIFAAQYLPTVGGLERYTNSLAKQLIKNGHSVIVVTSALKDKLDTQTDQNGIKIYRLPVKWFMDNRFPLVIFNAKFKGMAKKLKDENVDFALIQTRFYTNSLFASRFCKKNKIPAMVLEHGTSHLIRDGIVGFFGNVYEHIAAKYVYHNCKNFYGVSIACCKWLQHFGIKTTNVLYNAVNPNELLQILKQEENTLKQKLDFDNKTTIAFTGRFIKEKGVVQLITAFEKLHKAFPDTQLVMAGDGPLFEQAKAIACDGVVLLGKTSYSQSLALLKNSDIFCLPTFSEGFSGSILEAAALKAAIITTPTGGSPEIIISKNHGLLIDTMDESDIYNALCFALEHPDWRAECTENAYKVLCDNFVWDKVQKKFTDAAKQLIKG